ncbi:uncharacterized protein LOC127362195 [Dicentrarchus labrax]|uniref:uncharacterized protein LOC127362195 n=1 Tax=Dicentrarchus labrax TaxID=13489 RepID=UPI0021F5C2EF|nr:uncharacterized protein LOC127362195 [Dicentrarchus labrax]
MTRLLVHHTQDPLQFGYQEQVDVEDAILYLLQRAHSYLDKESGAVRIPLFDFSSAFNTIRPLLLRDKLTEMGMDQLLVTWITDYLTERPQYVRLKGCTSDTVVSSTGAPQGTVLSPALFTLYTSDFQYNSGLCHMQKYSDDTAIVGCIKDGREGEYRSLVEDFVRCCGSNHLQLNTSKTKEMVVDFRRKKPHLQPVSIEGVNAEVVRTYKYLRLQLDDKLDWTANMDTLHRNGQSRLYFLRRLGSFNICKKLLQMFYWGGSPERHRSTGQTGEESWLSGGHRAGLSGDSGRKKDPGQTAVHTGQHPPPSAQHLHQAEECVQWQTAVPVQTQKLFCPPSDCTTALSKGREDKRQWTISTSVCTVYCFCTVDCGYCVIS